MCGTFAIGDRLGMTVLRRAARATHAAMARRRGAMLAQTAAELLGLLPAGRRVGPAAARLHHVSGLDPAYQQPGRREHSAEHQQGVGRDVTTVT